MKTKTVAQVVARVEDIEKRNDKVDQQAVDDRTITVKEVYERVIQLETKFDFSTQTNKQTTRQFTWFALAISVFEIINLVLNLWLISEHKLFLMGGL